MRKERGAVLFLVILYSFLLSLIGLSVLYLNGSEEILSKDQLNRTRALYCAEAGLERAQSWIDMFGGFPTTVFNSTGTVAGNIIPYMQGGTTQLFTLSGAETANPAQYKFWIEQQAGNVDSSTKAYTIVSQGFCNGYTRELRREFVRVNSDVTFAYASVREFANPAAASEYCYWLPSDFTDSKGDFHLSFGGGITLNGNKIAGVFSNSNAWDLVSQNTNSRIIGSPGTVMQIGWDTSVNKTMPYTNIFKPRERKTDYYENLTRNTQGSVNSLYFETTGNVAVTLHDKYLDVVGGGVNIVNQVLPETVSVVYFRGGYGITLKGTLRATPITRNVSIVSDSEITITSNVIVAVEPVSGYPRYAVGLIAKFVTIKVDNPPDDITQDSDIQLDCGIAVLTDGFGVTDFNTIFGTYSRSKRTPFIHLNGCLYQQKRRAVGTFNINDSAPCTGFIKDYKFNPLFLNKLPPHFVGYKVYRGRWSDMKTQETQ